MSFGTPQFSGAEDYRFAQVSQHQRQARRAVDMKALWAPLPIKIAAALELFSAAYLVYYIFDLVGAERVPESLSRIDHLAGEFAAFLGLIVFALCVLTVYALRAQNWARIGLTVLSALFVVLIIAPRVWPVSLAGIAVVVLLWLPANRKWFGFGAA